MWNVLEVSCPSPNTHMPNAYAPTPYTQARAHTMCPQAKTHRGLTKSHAHAPTPRVPCHNLRELCVYLHVAAPPALVPVLHAKAIELRVDQNKCKPSQLES